MKTDTSHTGTLLPLAAILGAVLLWGSSFSAMRTVLNVLDPLAAMFLRFVVAGICLLPFAGKLWPRQYQKGDWKTLGAMVLCQPCLYFLFESRALVYTTSAQAGIISACLPLMVALAAFLFLSETIRKATVAGLFISVIGVVCLTLFQAQTDTAPNPVLGNLLEVGAMISACGYMILVKQLSHRYNTWTLTAMQVAAGAVFFLPGMVYVMAADPAVWTIRLIGLLVFLGAFVSLGAFGLYNYGISKVDAFRASIFINLIPVTAVALGWMLLGETLNLAQCMAAVLVIAGVILSNRTSS